MFGLEKIKELEDRVKVLEFTVQELCQHPKDKQVTIPEAGLNFCLTCMKIWEIKKKLVKKTPAKSGVR